MLLGGHCSWSWDRKSIYGKLLWQVWTTCSYHETWLSGSSKRMIRITRTTWIIVFCFFFPFLVGTVEVYVIVPFLLWYQNTNSTSGQIRYLVYCMEHAIKNLNLDQEQLVWLVDFQGWNTSRISMKVTRETAHILQDHYPERLGLAILYNPPKIFESFWTVCHHIPLPLFCHHLMLIFIVVSSKL